MNLKNLFKSLLTSTTSDSMEVKHELITEDFKAAGAYYYQDNLKNLAEQNPDWRKQVKTLVSKGKDDKRIYRYNFIHKPVKLIPEPNNPHDKNAIMIQVAGEKVGYIKADETVHVKNILTKYDVKYISSFIGGGEYKVIYGDGKYLKCSEDIHVTVRIAYVKK